MSEKELSEEEKLFCDIYIERTKNKTEVMQILRPHLKDKSAADLASRMWKKVENSRYFAEKSREFVENCGLSKKGQIQLLSEIVARSLKGKPKLQFNAESMSYEPMKDDDDKIVYEYDPKNVIAAIAEQNKMTGFHKDSRLKDSEAKEKIAQLEKELEVLKTQKLTSDVYLQALKALKE